MTAPTQTTTVEALRRIREASQQRINEDRPLQFGWRTIEDSADPTALQERVMNLHYLSGDPEEPDDEAVAAALDALAEKEAVFATAHSDFREVQARERCPKCGAWPPGSCGHSDPTASYASRPDAYGHGATTADPGWRNQQLKHALLAAGAARRAELILTRSQRISDKKAQVLAAMRQGVEVVSP